MIQLRQLAAIQMSAMNTLFSTATRGTNHIDYYMINQARKKTVEQK